MPNASPFDMMLAKATERAQKEPAAVFGELDTLYGKTLTDMNVRSLAAFAAHLGGSGLGKWEATIAFVEKCLNHDAVSEGSETWCSLKRALATLYYCIGDQSAHTDAIAAGVRTPSEHCRVAGLIAQALVARNRIHDAMKPLEQAQGLLEQVDKNDEVCQQISIICQGIARACEIRVRTGQQLQVLASQTLSQAVTKQEDWQQQHRGHYHVGRALVLAARPAEAMIEAQAMMKLESKHQAGAIEQCHSAALACLAQIGKGNLKIAKQALAACESLAQQIDNQQAKSAAIKVAEECAKSYEQTSAALERSQ